MGRKIPGKKHRGVKDPEKQQLIRLKRYFFTTILIVLFSTFSSCCSLKRKINAPPTDPDHQELPKSISRIAELKESLKNKGKAKYHELANKVKRKKAKQFEQFKGESDKHFLFRIQQACDTVIREKAFENKYGVEIKRNPNTGEVS